jgi:hypothetical protein
MRTTTIQKLFFVLFVGAAFYAVPTGTDAARLYLLPQNVTAYEGETIMSEIRLDTEGEAINAAEVKVSFPPNRMRVGGVMTGGSVFTMFPQLPRYSNEEGTLSVVAGIPNGFSGEGVVARVMFRMLGVGDAPIAISDTSQALLNDGRGTAARLSVSRVNYHIQPAPSDVPLVTFDYADETTWRTGPFVRLGWEVKEGATYSYLLSRNPGDTPDEVPDEPVGSIKLEIAEDGIFYFHLRECRNGICGAAVSRIVLKDTMPPEPFEPIVGKNQSVFGGRPFASFSTTDKTSGVQYYEVKVGNGEWQKATAIPYLIDDDNADEIAVRAVDVAGNTYTASAALPRQPINTTVALIVSILLLAVIGAYLLWKWLRPPSASSFTNAS